MALEGLKPGRLLGRAREIATRPTLEARLRAAADALWDELGDPSPSPDRPSVSWIGFYRIARDGEDNHGATPGEAMVLGPHRDKPACSPIGLHGACGQSLGRRAVLVVTDVAHLGAGYVACDPQDRAELVVPLFDDEGEAWGVLDADSFCSAAFDPADADAIERFCVEARLTLAGAHPAPREVI